MRDTVNAFFALVRAGLWEKEVTLFHYGEAEYSEVLRLSEEQSVVGLVAAGLEYVTDIKVPKDIALQFAGLTLQFEQQNKAMNSFIAKLVENLHKEDIYTLLLKGQGIAQCYERPLWRSCGDVDLFLSDDNYSKTKNFLLPLATCVEPEGEYAKHIGMTIDSWLVELHGRLFCGLSSRIEKELDGVYQDTFYGGSVRSWNNNHIQVFLLSTENDAFYVFTHILQHFYKGGIGLRQICDWCRLLWTYRKSLNRKLLESRIKRAGLMTEWKAFAAFVVEYLGMPSEVIPFYSADERWKHKADRICSFIMEVGNFGHNRDSSYYNKYPYVIRKAISLGRRISDLYGHARIFPLDSLRFFPYIVFNGVRSAIRGE